MRIHALALAAIVLFVFGCSGQDLEGRDGASVYREGSRGASEVALQDTVQAAAIPEPDEATKRLFQETMDYARAHDLHERPIGEVMTRLGERFMAKPYAAGLLDEPAYEQLVCTLNEFDCVTFVESMLAFGRAVIRQEYSYDAWARYMLDQRYRGGRLDGYCSRLHYFSDWIVDNERRGSVRNVTAEIGGERLEKEIDFMTEHRASYPRFAENDSLYQCIREMEQQLRGVPLYYVPQNRIAEVYDELRAGDIIAAATHIEGLDVTHTGLVYDHGDGTMGLLHASTDGGVKVSPDLQSYVQGVDSQIGIIVARPQEPGRP